MAERTPPILFLDITHILGDTLEQAIGWKDSTGAYVNFAGCTALAQIKIAKADAAEVDHFTVALGSAAANIVLTLPAAQVLALGVGKWVYDLQITHTDLSVRTYVSGKLKITQDVSR